MNRYIIFTLSLTLLIGCQKDSNNSQIPGQLNSQIEQEITQAKPISVAAKAKFAKLMKTSHSKLPTTALIFDNYTYEQSSKREKDLSRLDTQGKENLTKIKSTCAISPETEVNPSGPPVEGKPYTTEKRSSVSGVNCPINYSSLYKMVFTYTRIDKQSSEISGHGTIDNNVALVVLNETLKQQSLSAGYGINMSMKVISENYNYTSKSGAMYMIGTGGGEFITADNIKAPATMKMEALMRGNQTSMQVLVNVKLPDGEFVLGFISKDGKSQIYVNGEAYTNERLEQEFGMGDFITEPK